MGENRYMISDVSKSVEVENHVLRYWEEELELDISRNEMGHRYYTEEDIKKFQKIKELKDQGYQLKAIKMMLCDENAESDPTINEIVNVKESRNEPDDKIVQFKMLLGGMIADALVDNNQLIEREVSESVIKEIDYLLRVKEEADEDRYKMLDELIRSHQKRRGLFAKKAAESEKRNKSSLFKRGRNINTEYI